MALTLPILQSLESVGLVAHYDSTKATWKALFLKVYRFVKANYPTGAEIRRDDVAESLLPFAEVDKALADYLARKKLKQKYWKRHFCDLVIDKCWNQIGAAP